MVPLAIALVALAAVGIPGSEASALRSATSDDGALAQLVLALRDSTVEVERVSAMVDALEPIYAAVPRSPDGYLEASAVFYLLHRYFIDRNGWFLHGYGPKGE